MTRQAGSTHHSASARGGVRRRPGLRGALRRGVFASESLALATLAAWWCRGRSIWCVSDRRSAPRRHPRTPHTARLRSPSCRRCKKRWPTPRLIRPVRRRPARLRCRRHSAAFPARGRAHSSFPPASPTRARRRAAGLSRRQAARRIATHGPRLSHDGQRPKLPLIDASGAGGVRRRARSVACRKSDRWHESRYDDTASARGAQGTCEATGRCIGAVMTNAVVECLS